MSLKSGSTFPSVKKTFFFFSFFHLFLFFDSRSLIIEKTQYKKQTRQKTKETIVTIHHNLYIARDHGAQVCLPGCIQITCGRILALFLFIERKFYKQQSVSSDASEWRHSLSSIRRDWVKRTLSWWSKTVSAFSLFWMVQASVRCTQFLLIQGFWSCFVPQIVDIVWKI